MMKKITSIVIAIILLLSACGQGGSIDGNGTLDPENIEDTLSWQNYYDLGIRYLSEGNYQEAIIAFTAAIDIDPKQAPAYIGRGDAYVWQAELLPGVMPEETVDSYNNAIADYLAAIDIDPLTAELYEKLSNIYIELNNYDAAIAVLEQGYEATNDERLFELLEAMRTETTDESERYSGQIEISSIPLSYNVITDDGGISEILVPIYITDGSQSASGSGILYGSLSVNCPETINGEPFIVRQFGGTNIVDLEKDFFEWCPENYADSPDPTMENLHLSSYEEMFELMSTKTSHGAGWNSTTFIESDVWMLGVACYNAAGNRIGYAFYEISGSSVAQVKENCMVTANTKTGEAIPNQLDT